MSSYHDPASPPINDDSTPDSLAPAINNEITSDTLAPPGNDLDTLDPLASSDKPIRRWKSSNAIERIKSTCSNLAGRGKTKDKGNTKDKGKAKDKGKRKCTDEECKVEDETRAKVRNTANAKVDDEDEAQERATLIKKIMAHLSHRKDAERAERPRGIQVVCLGSGGGPLEGDVTGFLFRSTHCDWDQRGSVLAVDAGTHMSAILNLLTPHFPLVSGMRPKPRRNISATSTGAEGSCDDDDSCSETSVSPEMTVLDSGPFAGAAFPFKSARANAAHFVREHVDAYLITHPHLDHLSGFTINTAALHNTSRPKKVAALPFCINAMKQHIFNDIIWPNLTDEEDGVGFVTFQRLQEGGNLALGEGHSRGYVEVCNGLAVKAFKCSHGNCASVPRPTQEARRGSAATMATLNPQGVQGHSTPLHSQHGHSRSSVLAHNASSLTAAKFDGGAGPGIEHARRSSIFSQPSQPGTPTFFQSGTEPGPPHHTVVDSTAFFVRDIHSGREVLIFGDVEPDSVSNHPRNRTIWGEAAPKVAAGLMGGVFIECSYNDTQPDNILFGHMAPRHIIDELLVLAEMTYDCKRELAEKAGRKRKRLSSHTASGRTRASRTSNSTVVLSPKEGGNDSKPDVVPEEAEMTDIPPTTPVAPKFLDDAPLKGVRVVIIHMKDPMKDGPLIGDSILEDLARHEERLAKLAQKLGCTFEISKTGMYSIF